MSKPEHLQLNDWVQTTYSRRSFNVRGRVVRIDHTGNGYIDIDHVIKTIAGEWIRLLRSDVPRPRVRRCEMTADDEYAWCMARLDCG